MSQDSSDGHHEPLEPPNEHCIYEVPLNFRIRNNVYTPLLFSIGPLHYGKVGLAVMEQQKVEYYEKFCSRLYDDDPCLEEFMSFLQQHETRIRNTYRYVNGICPFASDVFQKMILHDSIFILELLLEHDEGAKDGLLNQTLLKDALIRRDLVLLENQVPYFVLEKLYKLFSCIIHPSLLILSCNFLRICMPKEVLSLSRKEQEKIKVAHFTDLARSALVGIIPRDLRRSSGKFLVVPTATTLKKSGVRFVPGGCILDMKCIRRKFLVWQCELRMPHVDITTFSECIFGNIRSLEHCAYESMSSHFSNFLLLTRSLVDSEDDLDFLVREKIISSKLGDEAEVLKFFKRVSEGITTPEVDSWGVCESLHEQVTFCDDV